MTTKRGYVSPDVQLNWTRIDLQTHTRYLGIELSEKLRFKVHIEMVTAKAVGTAAALSRLTPNVNGPTQRKRQLFMTVVNSQLLYAARIGMVTSTDVRIKRQHHKEAKNALRVYA